MHQKFFNILCKLCEKLPGLPFLCINEEKKRNLGLTYKKQIMVNIFEIKKKLHYLKFPYFFVREN